MADPFNGGMLALMGAMMGVVVVLFLAMYVYYGLVFMTIGKKLKYDKPWLAWIPFANVAMILQLGNFHWAWVFLFLIPIFGWIALFVLIVISEWRIYEKRNYPGALCLIQLAGFIPYLGLVAGPAHLVVLGLVAWSDRN